MRKKYETKGKTKMKTYDITLSNGKTYTVKPELQFYNVLDFLGRPMLGIAIELCLAESTEDFEAGESFAMLTVSFGEFISIKNAAYIDTNNCPFADQLLKYGIAKKTDFTKESGYCSYPLWDFNEDFLKEIGGEKYDAYSIMYDEYMKKPFSF